MAMQAVAVAQRAPRPDVRAFLARYGTIVTLVVVVAAVGIINPTFLGPRNISILLSSIAGLGLVAGGVTVLLVLGDFDLSIASSTTLAGVVAVVFTSSHHLPHPYLGFALGIAIGTAVGVVNGFAVTVLRLPSFITTLATMSGLQGLIYGYGGASVYSTGLPRDFMGLGQGQVLGLAYPTVIMVVGLVALWVMLEQTPLGRYMYLMGGNLQAARLRGVKEGRIRFLAFVLMGFIAGITGILLASAAGSSSPALSGTMLLDALAAVFLGASVIRPGQFHIVGTVVGVLVLGVLSNGMAYVNMPLEYQNLVKGAILLLGVSFTQLGRRL
jgi:ribose transport system permease protein